MVVSSVLLGSLVGDVRLSKAQQPPIVSNPKFVPPVKNVAGPNTVATPSGSKGNSAFENSRQQDVKSSSASQAGTRVTVPPELQRLFERGGVPDSLEQLRQMEQQQRQIADRAAKCTVSVKIGRSQGCGVIIHENGYILTAAHVAVRPNKEALVTLSDGRVVKATTLGMNRTVDAGLMRINPRQNGGRPWPHASLGTSDGIVPGMWCIAMGHPGGYDPTRGTVIRVGRLLQVRTDALVSDCALIGGDSGGPLFNIHGELIAVHSRIGNEVSINLHVPIDQYDHSFKRMSEGDTWGELPNFKPTIGVQGNKEDPLARIIVVNEGSPAEAGGLQPDDVIEQFGEKIITDFQSLKDAVGDTMPGELVPIWVVRGDRRLRVVVEIGRS